jgi:predicted metal-dependent peptidase
MATNLEKAKARLVIDHPFFATILLKYPLLERKDIKTLQIDRKGQISYNAEFIEAQRPGQIVWALAHEILHRVGNDLDRMGNRDHKKWNWACDAWNNDVLDDSKIGEVIEGTVKMPGSRLKSKYEIYDSLPDTPPDDGGGAGSEQGGMGNDMVNEDGEEPPPTDAEKREQEAQIKVDIAQAAQAARMKGKLSSSIARIVDEIIYVKTPWQDILERFMVNKVKNETTWNRPNRRYIGSDIYLPSLNSVGAMGPMVIGVDESGSIQNRELQHFGAHVNRIIETCKPEKVFVVHCDSRVSKVEEFGPEDYPIPFKAYGGGGTAFIPVFERIAELGIEPSAVVYFTDGYGDFPKSVDYPTIWAITTDVVAPAAAGETIHFDME